MRRVKLTEAQHRWLEQAAGLKPHQYLTWGSRANSGGSLYRMMHKLCSDGLLKGPPYRITPAGRALLASTKAEK